MARTLAALAAVVTALLILPGASRVAFADGKSDVATKLKTAMESYDTFDYDGARKQLTAAIALAKKSHLDKDPILAKAYLDLGIVAFAVPDQAAAKEAFVSAAQIDPKIQIDVAYKSPELATLLDKARLEAKTSAPAAGGGSEQGGIDLGGAGTSGDCSGVKGLEHTLVDTAKGGSALKLEAQLGGDVKASKVSIMFRAEGGSTDFVEVKMTKQGDCKYVGSIPSSAMKGSLVHYYIAAYDGGGKLITSKGTAGSPNIIEISGGGGGSTSKSGDDEDPLGGKHAAVKPSTAAGGDDDSTGVSASAEPAGKSKSVWIGVNGGTGGGYVTGTTEGGNTVKSCCLGENPVVILAELGFNISPKVAIGAAFRMGLPLGATVQYHATGAPGGLLRLHYALDPSGDGLHLLGEVGFGFLRNTLKLNDPNMDTDIVAQGPLIVGGGIGYAKKLGSMVAFTADVDALVGLAVVSTIGASTLNNGVSVDASIGFQFGLF